MEVDEEQKQNEESIEEFSFEQHKARNIRTPEEQRVHRLIGCPHDASHVHIAFLLRGILKVRHGIAAQQPEHQTVGHNVLTGHRGALFLVVELRIERIVGTKILVERDANKAIAHHDALSQCANLRIDNGKRHRRNELLQAREREVEQFLNIAHVGILNLGIGKDGLQRAVLIEVQEAGVDLCIVHLAQLQHVLEQGARLYGKVGVHLLKGGEIARGEITALQAIVAMHLQLLRCLHLFVRLQLKVAGHTENGQR